MTVTLTLEEILLFLLFVLGTVIGIYLIIVLKNANQLIVNANKTLDRNEETLAELLSHLEELSGNTARFSEELKKQFINYETAVDSILRSGAESMLAISETTTRIRTLAGTFNEMLRAVNRLVKK